MGSAEIQGALWSKGARAWSELQEKMHVPMYQGALDAVAPVTGYRMLDVGCGSGMFLQLARQRGARVFGLDASRGLLDVAQERVAEADLRMGDLESLPFEERAFDGVTAFNAVQ